MANTDPFRAVSPDRLHINSGLWRDHIWIATIKPYIEALSGELRGLVDQQ